MHLTKSLYKIKPEKTLKTNTAFFLFCLISLFICYKYILQVFPSVMFIEIMQSFSLTATSMGTLSACFFYAYLFMQIPAGIILDKYQLKYVLPLAIFISSFGVFLFSFTHDLYLANFARFLMGAGASFAAIGGMKVISVIFPLKYFARLSGFLMSFAMLGALGGYYPLTYLMNKTNFREALLVCFLIGVSLSILVYIGICFMKQKNTSKIIIKKIDILQACKHLLTNKQSWIISLYSSLAFAPLSMFAGLWGVPFLVQKVNISSGLSSSLVSLIFIGFAIGAPLSGYISDLINRRKPLMVIGSGCATLILFVLIYVTGYPIWIYALLLCGFGFFVSFFFVSFTLIREINPVTIAGFAIAFINMMNSLFEAISDTAIGKFLDLQWDGKMKNGVIFFSTHSYMVALSVLFLYSFFSLIVLYYINEPEMAA